MDGATSNFEGIELPRGNRLVIRRSSDTGELNISGFPASIMRRLAGRPLRWINVRNGKIFVAYEDYRHGVGFGVSEIERFVAIVNPRKDRSLMFLKPGAHSATISEILIERIEKGAFPPGPFYHGILIIDLKELTPDEITCLARVIQKETGLALSEKGL